MITLEQIKGARAMLGLSAGDLAKLSGLGTATIQRMESRGTGSSSAANVETVQKALENAGVVFISSNGDGPGVRLKKNTS